MAATLLQNVLTFIQQHRLISRGDHLLLGVSGGVDSIVMLHVLSALKYDLGITLSVATLDHNLRPTSAKEVVFVKEICASYNIPCYSKKLSKRSSAKKSIEEYARNERYIFFQQLVKKHKCTTLALAHHQDDVAETVLLNILRGSGLNGLKGILPKRTLFDMNVIRPFLRIKRKEIERYAAKNKYSFYEDESNADITFSRNNVRHKLIPYLEKNFSTEVTSHLNSLAMISAEDVDYLESRYQQTLAKITLQKTAAVYKLSFKKWASSVTSVRRGVLRLAIKELNPNLSVDLNHIILLEKGLFDGSNTWSMDLSSKMKVEKAKEQILIKSLK